MNNLSVGTFSLHNIGTGVFKKKMLVIALNFCDLGRLLCQIFLRHTSAITSFHHSKLSEPAVRQC